MIEESYMQYAIANKMEDFVREFLKTIPNNQKSYTRELVHKILQTGAKFVLEEIQYNLTNRYEEKFKKLVEKDDITIYSTLKEVIDTNINLKIGDYVLFINDYGAIFGPHKVLGFCKPNDVNGYIYLNYDCYWSPTQIDKIVKL